MVDRSIKIYLLVRR